MKVLWLALPLAFLLSACDNGDQPAPPPQAGQTADPALAAEHQDGLAGIWQPAAQSELKALVLEQDGRFYLVGDGQHRGINWKHQDDHGLTLHYLGNDQNDDLSSTTLTAQRDDTTLTLSGDSPFAGTYRRDASGIGVINGKVVLPSDVGIPDNGVLALTLQDIAPQGNTAEVITQRLTRLRLEQLAMPFRLYFDQARLQPGHHYSIRARVIADGAVHFINTSVQNVLDGQAGPVTLALQPATRAASYIGHYLYYADAARFTPCGGDRRLAVAGPHAAAMEKAYLEARSEPMAPVVMQVTGNVEKRPGEEPGTTLDTLIVESYRITDERVACNAPNAELTHTYWKLMHLAGQNVPAPQGQQSQPHLILAEGTVKGSTGCNSLIGRYQAEGDRITLDKLASTLRACTGPNVAREFVDSLKKTAHFNVDGQRLSLYDDNDHLLAVLQAEYL